MHTNKDYHHKDDYVKDNHDEIYIHTYNHYSTLWKNIFTDKHFRVNS